MTVRRDRRAARKAPVLACWPTPGGTWRTGALLVPTGSQAGSTVLVWVDAACRLTGPPLRPAQVRAQAALAAVLACALSGLLVLLAGLTVHSMPEQRWATAWDTGWAATEPRWSKRN